jgi:hypothetical protein
LENHDRGGEEELCGNLGNHRAREPSGRLRNKNEKREAYPGEQEESPSGRPFRDREPARGTRLIGHVGPQADRTKRRVPSIVRPCYYAAQLVEPQPEPHSQSRSAATPQASNTIFGSTIGCDQSECTGNPNQN